MMASQGVELDELFEATKYINAFWFPQQTLDIATYFHTTEGLSFAEMDAHVCRCVVFFAARLERSAVLASAERRRSAA